MRYLQVSKIQHFLTIHTHTYAHTYAKIICETTHVLINLIVVTTCNISAHQSIMLYTVYNYPVCVCVFCRLWLFGPCGLWPTRLLCPWHFSRQEYWNVLPFPPPEDLPDPGIEPTSPVSPSLQVDSLPLSHRGSPKLYTVIWQIYLIKSREI